MGKEGCILLSKANWPALKHLNISNNNKIKKAQASKLKDASTSARYDGGSSLDWIYVQIKLEVVNNNIMDEGCKWLVRANWPRL